MEQIYPVAKSDALFSAIHWPPHPDILTQLSVKNLGHGIVVAVVAVAVAVAVVVVVAGVGP